MELDELLANQGLQLTHLAAIEQWGDPAGLEAFLTGAGGPRKLIDWLGARLVIPNRPIQLDVPAASVDRLLYSTPFRAARGLFRWPESKKSLREAIVGRLGAGKSYQEIADWLRGMWIPTPTGLRDWRRSNIGNYIKNLPDEPYPIPAPGSEIYADFRSWAAEMAIAAVALKQPAFVIKAMLRAELEPTAICFRSEQTVKGAAIWAEAEIGRFLLQEFEARDGAAD